EVESARTTVPPGVARRLEIVHVAMEVKGDEARPARLIMSIFPRCRESGREILPERRYPMVLSVSHRSQPASYYACDIKFDGNWKPPYTTWPELDLAVGPT